VIIPCPYIALKTDSHIACRAHAHLCRESSQVPSGVKFSYDINESIWRKVQNTELPFVRFSLPSCYSLSLRFRYAPQHVFLGMTIRDVAHLPRRRPWFDVRTVRVEFEVDRAALRRALLLILWILPPPPASVTFLPCHKTYITKSVVKKHT
jgi:hypothetical protein